jgi:high affinity sulfate transporter 1
MGKKDKGGGDAESNVAHIWLQLQALVQRTQRSAYLLFKTISTAFYVPFLPPFQKPGWALKYFRGPYNVQLLNDVAMNVGAGISVAATLIPQVLSYANLANIPPISGLYSVILPIICYVLFGTSPQVSVGPVSVVSLLTGVVVQSKVPDFATNHDAALNVACQMSFLVGIILTLCGLLNLGSLVRFFSFPALIGFTTGAAMVTGLNQLKPAFGFGHEVPTVGQGAEVAYNYQLMEWFIYNWNDYVNPYASKISMGVYIPLFAVYVVKTRMRVTPSMQKQWWYKVWIPLQAMSTLIAIIIAAFIARSIKTTDSSEHATALKIVGTVPSGVDIFKQPQLDGSIGDMLNNGIIIALMCFMESFSVARNIATPEEVDNISASQELFALGVGNLLNSVASGLPVTGSFSRSALCKNSGGTSQLSQLVTLGIVFLCLSFMTSALYWIPSAALGAVVMIAIVSLIDLSKFTFCWKVSKLDFVQMTIVWAVTLFIRVDIGFYCAVGIALLFHIVQSGYSKYTEPEITYLQSSCVILARVNSDLVYFTFSRFKVIVSLCLRSAFDKELSVQALVIDLDDVRLVDVSAALGLKDLAMTVRSSYGLRFVYINATPHVLSFLSSVDLHSDRLNVTRFYLEKIAAQVDWRHRSKFFHRKQLQDHMLFIPGRITDDTTSAVGSWIRNEQFGRSQTHGLGRDASPSHSEIPSFGMNKRILSLSRLNESAIEDESQGNEDAEVGVRPITPRLFSASSMPMQPSGAMDEEVDDESRECVGLELPLGRHRVRSV